MIQRLEARDIERAGTALAAERDFGAGLRQHVFQRACHQIAVLDDEDLYASRAENLPTHQLISIRRGWACWTFFKDSVNTPSFSVAPICCWSIMCDKANRRAK